MKYKLRINVILKGEKDFFLAYDAESGSIIEVNEIAFRILQFCKKPKEIQQILLKIKKDYKELPKDIKLQKDIKEILDYLIKSKILENG